MRRFAIIVFAVFTALPLFGTTYTVNDLGDGADNNPGDDICSTGTACTLRAAIMEANAHAGGDAIHFSVAGVIAPGSPLPPIADANTQIDGSTAPGYLATPLVTLNGQGSVPIGLDIQAISASVNALQIYGFTTAGIQTAATDASVTANYLGPVTGVGTANGVGVMIIGGDRAVIGQNAQSIGNVISGNTTAGILITGGNDHQIYGNRIGTNAAGAAAVPNGTGIRITTTAGANIRIGHDTQASWNVISGNTTDGIHLDGASGVTVAGNYIGTNATGTTFVRNLRGIRITASTNNVIGTTAARNIVSGNSDAGIFIENGSTGNTLANNYVGVSAAGTGAIGMGNGDEGILIFQSDGNTIGTTAARNVISHNGTHGIAINESDNTIVHNNTVGLDVNGAGSGNGQVGVQVLASTNVDIGGAGAGEGNVVSSNFNLGIVMNNVQNSRIRGNVVGLSADGTTARGNAAGIVVSLSTNITIGGPGAARNVVGGHNGVGIRVTNGSGYLIENNRVGTNGAGTAARSNTMVGISVAAATNTTIRSNLVSGNAPHGIDVTTNSTGTVIHSNVIGLSADLSAAIPNAGDGVNIGNGVSGTIVGSVALGGNIIANNGGRGIGVSPNALLGNTWAANSIDNNGGLGIDLQIDGVTENDLNDPDTGPNNRQNFPIVVSAVSDADGSQFRGTINTNPNTLVAIHVYSSPAADPSGNGEGQTYLGTTSVTTDASGNATWTVIGMPVTLGHVATATATGPSGSSEFSDARTINAFPTIQFSLASYTVAEDAVNATITVTRSGDLTVTSTVQYATSNNTALTGSDYTAASGTLTFDPGVVSQTFNIPITNDALDEPAELVTLTLSTPSAATLGAPATAQVEITDDDPPPSILIDDVTLPEGNSGTTNFTFTISLNAPSAQEVQINYATADGTALAGSDYTITSGTATIPAGSLSTQVTVPVTGDDVFELDDTFFLDLTAPVNATIGDNRGAGTITNDESEADLSITKTTNATTYQSGQPVTFTITVTNAGPGAATSTTVTDVLPPEMTFVSATPSTGSCAGTTTVICNLGTLAAGTSATISLVVTVNGAAPVMNTASVASANADPAAANNSGSATLDPALPIPTLSMWMLMGLGAALVVFALKKM